MSPSRKLPSVLPALLSLTPALLAAQTTSAPTPTPVVELDPIDVTASRVSTPSLTVADLASARADLALTPGGVEVIDAERFLTGRASTLADTFFLSPGVVALSRFGSDEARLSIRGSGLQRTFHGRGIRVLQDGVPINLADGGFDMQSLEPTATAYIKVWRGGNALAYGGSTLGGAIDYASRNGRNSPGGLARLELGSFAYLRATAAAGFTSESTSADAYASFTQQQQNGFRNHAEQNNQRLFTNAGLRLSETAETRLYLTAIRTDSELPGNLTKAELNADPTRADTSFFGSVRYDNKRDFDLVRLASKTTVEVGADTTIDLITAFTVKDLDHPITPFVGVIDQYSKDLLLGTTLTHAGDTLFLRAGLMLTQGQTDAATFQNLLGGTRGALTADADQTASNLEIFTEEQIRLGHSGFTAIIGASAAFNRRENDQRLGAAASYDRDYEGFSPKLGLRWDNPARDLQFYTNVSGSYEPPSFSETNAGAVANDAQTAVTVELGSRGQRGPVRWDASVYHSQVRDEFLSLNDALGTPLGTVNADRTIHQGIEVGLEADLLGTDWNADTAPSNRLVLRTAWTYGRFKFDDDAVYGDNTLAGLPPHLVRGELLWETKSGYYFGPTFEWVPVKSYIDHANTFSSDTYALLGWKLGRRVGEGLSWFVEAKNLTDETYAATHNVIADALGADARAFLPGDGRSVFAGIEYRW
jgi:iron complex outermembrane receptor protein